MNGIHDLGGMHGFGPVEREEHEPAFHADWERVVVAINNACRSRGVFNIDEFRHGIERMDPAHYLASTYYEHWLDGITRLLVEKGVVDPAALDARTGFFEEHPDAPAAAVLAGPPPERLPASPEAVRWSAREATAPPRFTPGDRVITRTISPPGHTRLPRYARGKRGVIHRCHGVHVFPDTNAHGLGEQPQPVYSVRFDARELWGDAADPKLVVHLDLWESYLLPG
jgi:nitrile hydratase beta subunit